MAEITRWEPFGEMLSLRQAIDRLFEDAFIRPPGVVGAGELTGGGEGRAGIGFPIDVYEQDDDLVVRAVLPGVKPEDVDISVQGNTLTIQGETREETESGRGRFHRRERRYGSFFRQLQLPTAIQTENADARFENGVLMLRLPKAEEARERRINIQSGSEISGMKEIATGETPEATRESPTRQPATEEVGRS